MLSFQPHSKAITKMLNEKERRRVLKFLCYCSIFNLVRVQVDIGAWDLHAGAESKSNLWICYFSDGLFVCNALYKSFMLAHTMLFLQSDVVPLHQILIHVDLASFSLLICVYYYVLHLESAAVNTAFVRVTLTGNLVGGEKEGAIFVKFWCWVFLMT